MKVQHALLLSMIIIISFVHAECDHEQQQNGIKSSYIQAETNPVVGSSGSQQDGKSSSTWSRVKASNLVGDHEQDLIVPYVYEERKVTFGKVRIEDKNQIDSGLQDILEQIKHLPLDRNSLREQSGATKNLRDSYDVLVIDQNGGEDAINQDKIERLRSKSTILGDGELRSKIGGSGSSSSYTSSSSSSSSGVSIIKQKQTSQSSTTSLSTTSSKPSSTTTTTTTTSSSSSNLPSSSTSSTQQSGGYTTLSSIKNSSQANEAISFVNSIFNQRLATNSVQITRVQQQIVSGTNFKISYLLDNAVEYEVVVYRALDGRMQLTSASLVNVPAYRAAKTVPVAQLSGEQDALETIDQLLRAKGYAYLGRIAEADVQRPYYGLLYSNRDGSSNRVVVVFDRVTQQLQVISNQSVAAPAAVTPVVTPMPVVPVAPTTPTVPVVPSSPSLGGSTSSSNANPSGSTTSTSSVSTPSSPPITGQTGGYTTLDPTQNSVQAIEAINYANNYFNQRLNVATNSVQITRVQQQIVSGTNFKISYLLDNAVEYEVVVYRALDGRMQLTSASLVNVPAYRAAKTVPVAQLSGEQDALETIDQLLRAKGYAYLGRIAEADVQRPYYGLLYSNRDGSSNRVVVVFDRVTQQLQVISNQSVAAPAAVTPVVTPTPIIPVVPTPPTVPVVPVVVPVVPSAPTVPVVPSVPIVPTETVVPVIPSAPVVPVTPVISPATVPAVPVVPSNPSSGGSTLSNVNPSGSTSTSSSSPSQSNTNSSPTNSIPSSSNVSPSASPSTSTPSSTSATKFPSGFSYSMPFSYPPSSTQSTASAALGLLAQSYISTILSESFIQSADKNKLETVLAFLSDKLKLNQQITILLLSQIRYAFRIVIEFNSNDINNTRIFQALVSTITRPSPIRLQLDLLSWRLISSVTDADAEIFKKYYYVQNQNIGVYAQQILDRVLAGDALIGKLKKILKVQKRPTYDGVYYRYLLEIDTGKQYELTVYWLPQTDYIQIIKYRVVYQDGFSVVTTTNIDIKSCDGYCVNARQFVSAKFPALAQSSTLLKIQQFNGYVSTYYRFVYIGISGRHEYLVEQTPVWRVVVMQKYDDVYIVNKTTDLNPETDANLKSAMSTAKTYYAQKFPYDKPSLNYTLTRIVSGFGKFYKFLFIVPVPIVITVEQNLNNNNVVRGVQRIMILPNCTGYEDKNFQGYYELNKTVLANDYKYKIFYDLMLKNRTDFTPTNHRIVSAYKKYTPLGQSIYQILYDQTTKGILYIANFTYNYQTNKYYFANFDQWRLSAGSPGDYQFSCFSTFRSTPLCAVCTSSSFKQTSGKCYSMVGNCDLQVGGECFSCRSGYTNVNGYCMDNLKNNFNPASTYNNTNTNTNTNATSFVPFTPNITWKIITATRARYISYPILQTFSCTAAFTSNVLCSDCKNRYYLKRGICQKVDENCATYDKITGDSLTCNRNYHVRRGICIKNDSRCAQSNANGECVRCVQGYKVYDTVCVVSTAAF